MSDSRLLSRSLLAHEHAYDFGRERHKIRPRQGTEARSRIAVRRPDCWAASRLWWTPQPGKIDGRGADVTLLIVEDIMQIPSRTSDRERDVDDDLRKTKSGALIKFALGVAGAFLLMIAGLLLGGGFYEVRLAAVPSPNVIAGNAPPSIVINKMTGTTWYCAGRNCELSIYK
jgi:hypothetical protein